MCYYSQSQMRGRHYSEVTGCPRLPHDCFECFGLSPSSQIVVNNRGRQSLEMDIFRSKPRLS